VAGPLARWILSCVVKSALVFETDAIETYRRLQESVGADRSCCGAFADSLCHLLEEERRHRQILSDASAGRLGVEELEKLLAGHPYASMDGITQLAGEALARWGPEVSRALGEEEKAWIFYTNLRRTSRSAVVRKAFEVLGHMEKEHIDILRVLLGRSPPSRPGSSPSGQAASP
jgi:rubrerythrin